ncbi:MAG: response regulator transcription factor [Microscillaceae bacterium]|jgi:DNA-binding response OmpR family regulator|nr:response regulator transcription factor [Microscillaceae bacterium]
MDIKAKILFVEDDLSLAMVTKDSLELRGYEVIHCENGEVAWTRFNKEEFDACILDVMMPKVDGFTLAERIRNKNQNIPILFLTAKSLQEDKIAGLKLGADDYITKPFSIEELSLKIEVFLKRTKPETQKKENQPKKYTIGNYQFDFDNLNLELNGQIRQLTLREAEVLQMFCQNLNVVLKREEILKKIWGQDDYFMGRSMDVFITRLRKYLKDDPNIKLENIPSVGFKMVVS